MIKIELQFETGAEARQALNELLGHGLTTVIRGEDLKHQISIKDGKIAENFEAPKTEIEKEEKPAEEIPAKKRRTKAEIEAEKKAVTDSAEDDIQSNQAETLAQDNKEQVKAVTKEMLQEKSVSLIRQNKKEEVVAAIKSFGADSISQPDKSPVKSEDYAALMDKLNAIG